MCKNWSQNCKKLNLKICLPRDMKNTRSSMILLITLAAWNCRWVIFCSLFRILLVKEDFANHIFVIILVKTEHKRVRQIETKARLCHFGSVYSMWQLLKPEKRGMLGWKCNCVRVKGHLKTLWICEKSNNIQYKQNICKVFTFWTREEKD